MCIRDRPKWALNFLGKVFGPDVKSKRKLAWKKAHDNSKLTKHPTLDDYSNLLKKGEFYCSKILHLTLFLFDNSGSMGEGNKHAEAKKAGLETLTQLKQDAKQSGKTPSVGIMTFAGGCVDNPTWMPNSFSTDLDAVENIMKRLPYPGGGTPLPQAIQQAENKLKTELATNGQSCGDLIVLGDGQSSCGQIRPPQAYAGVQSKKNLCGQNPNGQPVITYYTVGFGIQPGLSLIHI